MSDIPRPEIAERFLREKLNVETENWNDLQWGEHSHAFTVAHSMSAGVLDAIHGLLNKAVEEGVSFQEFRSGMLDMMKEKGWYGGAGHTEDEKRYINWRIGVIYDTNMSTAYSAERYRKQLEGADLRPIWVYRHDPAVANPRPDHLALDGKAFRFDDPIWGEIYPKNGWNCECDVETESEEGAKRDGVEVLNSGEDGGKPDIPGVDWDKFDPTWRYNPALEAIAPNFAKYKNLSKEDLRVIKDRFRQDAGGTTLSFGEMKKIHDAMDSGDYQFAKRRAINYQAGNLEGKRLKALKTDDGDSRVMMTEERVWRAFREKGGATVPEDCMADAYQALQQPDIIFEEKKARNNEQARIFHFVKNTKNKKIINAVLEKRTGFSLKVRAVDLGELDALLNAGDLKELYHE